MQWQMQVGNLTTDLKYKIDFSLSAFSATKLLLRERRLDYSTEGRYDMILGTDLLTELWLKIYF